MTSWMKERDRLLEQTLAFVQGVTAKRPITVIAGEPAPVPQLPVVSEVSIVVGEAPLVNQTQVANKIALDASSNASSAETDALLSLMVPFQHVPETDRSTPDPIAVADVASPIRAAAKPPVHQPAARRPVDIVLPERELIARRVARFRAMQQKTLQDREIDYEAAQAKIRAALGNDPFG